jgi:hypothetical protein
MCLKVKHILTSGGECKKLSPVIPKCTFTSGITFMHEFQIFVTLVERVNKHQFGDLEIPLERASNGDD